MSLGRAMANLLLHHVGENWGRQRLQRPEAPGGPINRAEGRWGGGGGGWGPEDHSRSNWDGKT